MYDVIIVGAGPAGVSAGLYAKRANLNVLILYHGESNLEKAMEIDNYYGFANGVDGATLYKNGISQAKNLGIDVRDEEVLNIEKIDNFIVQSVNGKYESKAVIIATGNKKLRPNIKGILDFEGKGISYCAICDGFFYRNKDVVVIGNGEFALSEADDLKRIVNKITILTDGMDMPDTDEYEITTKRIKELHGDTKLRSIEFEDGEILDVDGVFIALGEAGGSDFAKKLGVLLSSDTIVVDENMMTNVDGLFSCGNANGGLLQVAKAVYEGAKAGLAVVNYCKNK